MSASIGMTLLSGVARSETEVYLWTLQRRSHESVRVDSHIIIRGDIMGLPQSLTVEKSDLEAVQSINARGDAALAVTCVSNVATYNGKKQPDDARFHQAYTISTDKHGRVVKDPVTNNQDAYGVGRLWIMLAEHPAPETAVAIGDSWKTEIRNRCVDNSKTILTSKLADKSRFGNMDVLHIVTAYTIQTQADSHSENVIHVAGEYWVDPIAEHIVKSQYTVTNLSVKNGMGMDHVEISIRSDYSLYQESTRPKHVSGPL